jgi:hypothetical protein
MYQPYERARKESEKSANEYWPGRTPWACGLTEEPFSRLSVCV